VGVADENVVRFCDGVGGYAVWGDVGGTIDPCVKPDC
jgi:hypothetical protein